MIARSILLDESADLRLVGWLRSEGADVSVIAVDHPASLNDRAVLAIALQENRLLITRDNDFGELVVGYRQPHAGAVLFRLRVHTLARQQTWLRRIFSGYPDQLDRFFVVTDDGIRVR